MIRFPELESYFSILGNVQGKLNQTQPNVIRSLRLIQVISILMFVLFQVRTWYTNHKSFRLYGFSHGIKLNRDSESQFISHYF